MLICNCGRKYSLREKLRNKCDGCNKDIKIEWDDFNKYPNRSKTINGN
jgi:hypothetical protein